ncbi:pyridoxamine 5'-phosphate oxidase family protein [Bythopirellula polymerisocia]|uniref:Pyridoxamine 5'-phosphate oxidase n=1 Tax=Bythopirellula polymerisocia TaxID=2528003 RepID=A0A5C6CTE0_9BACT|nr:pyridoxamine 5'-phosphate oxidase family protein [Bythopirellula polymerisocia]TWU27658.1 Pyridoxamine 5'-phosphate oxidase [Bythopirellula polymerisocia]
MSKKDLYNAEAKEKIKKLAEGIDFAMLATKLGSTPIHMVPMSTKKVDDEGNIWFLSGKDSQHNQNIIADKHVHLIYSNTGAMQFMNVFGQTTISTDKVILRELYSSTDDAWFEGVDDPNLTALKVEPSDVFYWDPKNNKLVTLLKIGVAAFTGDEPDVLDQGEIKISQKDERR